MPPRPSIPPHLHGHPPRPTTLPPLAPPGSFLPYLSRLIFLSMTSGQGPSRSDESSDVNERCGIIPLRYAPWPAHPTHPSYPVPPLPPPVLSCPAPFPSRTLLPTPRRSPLCPALSPAVRPAHRLRLSAPPRPLSGLTPPHPKTHTHTQRRTCVTSRRSILHCSPSSSTGWTRHG